MSKRRIEAALRRKGLSCSVLEYGYQATPGEMVGGWDLELSDESQDAVFDADPDFDDFEPDCLNTAEVLEWVSTLPNCATPSKARQTEAAE